MTYMRVLYIPFFSNRNLGGCSIFNMMKVLFRSMLEIDPKMFVYWPLPEGEEWDTSAATEYLKHPRIKIVKIRALPSQEDEAFFFPERLYDLFNADTGKHMVDLVVSDKPRTTLWVHAVLNNHIRAVDGSIPFINVAQFVAAQASDSKYKGFSEIFDFAQVLGWYTHPTVWSLEQDRKRAMAAARRWAQGSVVKKIMETSYPEPVSFMDFARMDAVLERMPKRSKSDPEIRIHYGSRFQSGYRYKDLFNVAEILFQAGRNVKLVITSPNNTGRDGSMVMKKLRHRGMNHELTAPCSQEQFYEKAATCHVVVWFAKKGGAAFAIREQAYMGQIAVMPRSPVNEEMFPDYPYFYSNPKELQALVRYLIENYWSDEVQETIQKTRRSLRERYDPDKNIPKLNEFFREVCATGLKSVSSSVRFMIKECMEAAGWPARLTYPEYRELVKKHSRIKRDIEINYTSSNRRQCVAALLDLGYEDTCQEAQPVYVKRKSS